MKIINYNMLMITAYLHRTRGNKIYNHLHQHEYIINNCSWQYFVVFFYI